MTLLRRLLDPWIGLAPIVDVDDLGKRAAAKRAEIAHRINLKFAPDIRFRVDDRFTEAERIDKLLRSPDVQRDLKHDEDGE